MSLKLLGLMLLLASLCCAECPFRFVRVSGKHRSLTRDLFLIEVENVSGKAIRGAKFKAAYYDATEDLQVLPIAWNAHSLSFKPGTIRKLTWDNDYFETALLGWIAAPLKVLFEDGSTWEATPDNLKGCIGEDWRDKKHPRLTEVPVQILKGDVKAADGK